MLSFWRGEWRCRRGRNGRRKIAIDHRSMSMAQLSSSRLMPTGPSHPGNPLPSTGLLWASLRWTSGGLTSRGLSVVRRNENGSTHGMDLRQNEHAVGARRMRNCLIQPYPDSQGEGAVMRHHMLLCATLTIETTYVWL